MVGGLIGSIGCLGRLIGIFLEGLEGFLVVVPEDFQDVQQLPEGLWMGCLEEGFVGKNPFG
jgi:hypothetical protein